ncbi:MAG: 50S ribosomal protein L18 [Mariniphaga sp.]|nr:50S ribosomal protein L18 [Mariniphaga sp.]
MALTKLKRRNRIKKRIRKIVTGTSERPRMCVFRSNKQIYVQLIDDLEGKTLLSATSNVKENSEKEGTKTDKASMLGKLIAEKALAVGITQVVFDRNGYLYHGRVKQLADAARKGGLKF